MDALTIAPPLLGALILLAFVASYIQSLVGFAMGMMLMAVAGGLDWLPIATLAATISLLSLVNCSIALRRHWRHIDLRLFGLLSAGQVPAIAVGVWLLGTLTLGAVVLLKLLLGLFIALGSLILMLRPRTLAAVSSAPVCVGVGVLGGLVGGMFAASGPVIGWFNYRQPLPFAAVRATLLACFGLTTATRTLVVTSSGGMDREILTLFVLLLPVVALGSWLGDKYPPPLAETALKRGAFGLLFLMGVWICIDALARASG
ncbi:MAG: TSUP family transporter [Pseudomonadales bacterium]